MENVSLVGRLAVVRYEVFEILIAREFVLQIKKEQHWPLCRQYNANTILDTGIAIQYQYPCNTRNFEIISIHLSEKQFFIFH